jgi:hypothetical protein
MDELTDFFVNAHFPELFISPFTGFFRRAIFLRG